LEILSNPKGLRAARHAKEAFLKSDGAEMMKQPENVLQMPEEEKESQLKNEEQK
jgi:hypothetical protein